MPCRRLGVLAFVVALVCGLAGCSSGKSVSSRSIVTQVLTFHPFVSTGPAPGITIGLKTTGDCIGSIADGGRPDTYRCFLNNTEPGHGNIIDPCFKSPNGETYVLCFQSPWDHSALEVQPTSEATGNPLASDDPWALKLTNGRECTYVTGATLLIGKMRLNYGCTNGAQLWGNPDHSKSLWTIDYQANGSKSLVRVGIITAYS